MKRQFTLLFCMLTAMISACDAPPAAKTYGSAKPLLFQPLPIVGCPNTEIDYNASVMAAQKALDGGAADAALLEHFRDLRCLSARDFKTAYNAMMQSIPDPASMPQLAPLVFIYLDMGARLIDEQARHWLLRANRASKGESALAETRFYAATAVNLRSVPTELNRGLLRSLAGSTWLSRCSFNDMAWTAEGAPYCPGDDVCPLLRHTMSEEMLDGTPPDELAAICEELCRLIPRGEELATAPPDFDGLCAAESGGAITLPEPQKAGVFACLEAYLDATNNPNDRFACIISQKRSPLDLLMNLTPATAVAISDYCKLANNEEPDPKEDLEERKKELEEEKDRLTKEHMKEMDEKFPLPPWPGTEEDREYQDLSREYLRKMKSLRLQIEEIDRQIKKIEEQRENWPGYSPATRCAQDDFSCSDECSIQDQQRKAFYECITRDLNQPELPIVAVEPEEPGGPEPDPDVTDPPDDGPVDNPAFTALTECISNVLTPEDEECAQNLRCADGSIPTKNDMGFCSCPGSGSLPGELPCESVIECAVDEPCECPDSPGEATPAPAPNPGTILIIES